jgi:hypothetical protein
MVTSTVLSIRASFDENNSRGGRLHAATSIEADIAAAEIDQTVRQKSTSIIDEFVR